MTSTRIFLAPFRLFALTLVMTAGVCSAASAADVVCGVEFDAAKFGFAVQPPQPDEASGCGRFLRSLDPDGADELVVSFVVLSGHASHALKTVPNNFIVSKDNSIKFRRPRPVSDSRSFYFVRPLGPVSERRLSMHDSTIYIAEHKRRVDRLKKISIQEEQEVTELQRCVDAVRTSATLTLVLSGCDLAKKGSSLSLRLLPLVQSANLPAASVEQPTK